MVVHAFAMECIAITGFREFGISEILRAGFVLTFWGEKGASIFWHFVMQARFMSYLASVFFCDPVLAQVGVDREFKATATPLLLV